MLKKITLVTLLISCGVISAELVSNEQTLTKKVESQNIQVISLDKIPQYKCSPYPFCADYPQGDRGDSNKTTAKKMSFVSR